MEKNKGFDPFDLAIRSAELLSIVPDCMKLYTDITKDFELDDKQSLVTIVDFARSKSEYLHEYVAPNEVLMFVCSVLGFLHKGDSSELYLKLIKVEEESNN